MEFRRVLFRSELVLPDKAGQFQYIVSQPGFQAVLSRMKWIINMTAGNQHPGGIVRRKGHFISFPVEIKMMVTLINNAHQRLTLANFHLQHPIYTGIYREDRKSVV